MEILSTKSPPSPPSPAGKMLEIPLEDKVRIMQKFGTGLTDEEIITQLELEDRRFRNVIENEKRIEHAAAEQVQIEDEKRKIASAELGKKIIVSLNRQRVRALNAEGSVPCPACGSNFALATGAVLEIAGLLRGGQDPYDLIRSQGFGSYSAVPCIHSGGVCPHCRTSAEVLVQVVI